MKNVFEKRKAKSSFRANKILLKKIPQANGN